jgi:hypothetical protein
MDDMAGRPSGNFTSPVADANHHNPFLKYDDCEEGAMDNGVRRRYEPNGARGGAGSFLRRLTVSRCTPIAFVRSLASLTLWIGIPVGIHKLSVTGRQGTAHRTTDTVGTVAIG